MANKKLSFSGEEKSLDEIMSWYDDQQQALLDFRNKIIYSFLSNTALLNDKFSDFSLDEIRDYFDQSKEELEHLVCFDLISATEAKLRVDYNKKATEKHRTDIARAFRLIYNEKQANASLKNDIIECWKTILYAV